MVAGCAPHLPCCVWPAACGHELCECVDTSRLTVCSSGSSSGIRRDALLCAQWRGVLACTCMRKSFHRHRTSGHPPQSSPWCPGSPGNKQECLNAAGLWMEEGGRQRRRKCPGRKGRHRRRRRKGREGRSSHWNERSFVRGPVGGRRDTEDCSAPLPACHHQSHPPLPSLGHSLCLHLFPPLAPHQI